MDHDGDALRDDQWERVKPFVPGGSKGKCALKGAGVIFLSVLALMEQMALGHHVRLIAGPGQQNDAARGDELIDGLKADAQGGTSVIPPRRHCKASIPDDEHLGKKRNAVERFFNKIKHFCRVATRYDTLPANFFGFVKIAAIAIWLR